MQNLTPAKTPQNICDHLLVVMKFSDVVAKVFVLRITEEIELCLIRSQDRAIGADPMQRYGTVVEEVLKVLFALLEAVAYRLKFVTELLRPFYFGKCGLCPDSLFAFVVAGFLALVPAEES